MSLIQWKCILQELIFAVHKESFYFNLILINDTKVIFFVEHYSFALKSRICLIVHTLLRSYSRPLLGATIAPNLVPWILKNIFSLEMVRRCSLKTWTMSLIYRISSVTYSVAEKILSFDHLINQKWIMGNWNRKARVWKNKRE